MMVEAYVSVRVAAQDGRREGGTRWVSAWDARRSQSRVREAARRGRANAAECTSSEGAHPYLYLDATFLDARWARKVENVSCAKMAYAVGPDGHPLELLRTITLGPAGIGANSWSELLEQLLERAPPLSRSSRPSLSRVRRKPRPPSRRRMTRM